MLYLNVYLYFRYKNIYENMDEVKGQSYPYRVWCSHDGEYKDAIFWIVASCHLV